MKEIKLTPFLENLLIQDIKRKNDAIREFDLHLKIVFESTGTKMPDSVQVEIRDGKLFYKENT